METTLTPRQTFRQTVAAVAALAKAKLPTQVNGRVESAVKLVLSLDVEPQADGSILVGSSSDPMKQYSLTGQACTCQDFARGQAPDGWCQHRIAAAIAKRVQALLPDPLKSIERMPAGVHGNAHTPQPLPEAPASVNVHLTIDGRDCQLTLRDTDESRLLQRLQAVLAQPPQTPASPQGQPQGQLSPQQHNAAAMHRPVSGFCPVHTVQMHWNEGKAGRKGWYSHRTDDGWCKGRSWPTGRLSRPGAHSLKEMRDAH